MGHHRPYGPPSIRLSAGGGYEPQIASHIADQRATHERLRAIGQIAGDFDPRLARLRALRFFVGPARERIDTMDRRSSGEALIEGYEAEIAQLEALYPDA